MRTLIIGCVLSIWPGCVWAAEVPVYDLMIENHRFTPETLHIPPHQRVIVRVINRDATPEEFESHTLHREKIILGGSETRIKLGPLPPGRHHFFGEFHPETAIGTLVVGESEGEPS